MKVAVKKAKPTPKPPETYPVVKSDANEDFIILFTSPNAGVCLVASNNRPVGKYSEAWPEVLYTVFTGSVTLSND